jgi:hypothetical protein
MPSGGSLTSRSLHLRGGCLWIVGSCPIAARKQALSEWDKANPDNAELFRREILPSLAGVKLAEIAEASGCSKASASDMRRGKWTPYVSTWGHSGSWLASAFGDTSQHKRGVSHSPPDQPRFRPSRPQGDR